jgi:hypothetical protein
MTLFRTLDEEFNPHLRPGESWLASTEALHDMIKLAGIRRELIGVLRGTDNPKHVADAKRCLVDVHSKMRSCLRIWPTGNSLPN